MNQEYLDVVEQQRLYYKTVKDFTEVDYNVFCVIPSVVFPIHLMPGLLIVHPHPFSAMAIVLCCNTRFSLRRYCPSLNLAFSTGSCHLRSLSLWVPCQMSGGGWVVGRGSCVVFLDKVRFIICRFSLHQFFLEPGVIEFMATSFEW